MSLTMFFVPLSIAVIATATESLNSIIDKFSSNGICETLATNYTDCNLLVTTLEEHGIEVEKISENCVYAIFKEGKIVYERESEELPFELRLTDISDVEALVCNLQMIESEYRENVQSYSYNRVMNNLPENMSVDSEMVMEDNSIVITLNVD